MKVGKYILENLTTGMYSDSKVIYREYIQNACDQIDRAHRLGILSKDKGSIDIYIGYDERFITITDDATGVRESEFVEIVGDIANSGKRIGENKGFRGIGRLCGLAYCKTLKFVTSYPGESVKSIMTCDAQKMREILESDSKPSLDEVWRKIVSYSKESEKSEARYFEVQLIDVNEENTDLLDVEAVQEYLSFVAPVPYANTFILRNQVYAHAAKLEYSLDEYDVKVNSATVFKEYTTSIKDKYERECDEIGEVAFNDFYDDSGKLIAWMWVGVSRFEQQIPPNNRMRGLRLRSGNIQIGDDEVLIPLFKEHRGNFYFIGEVFAVDKELIPNSQRDYFNENAARIRFEKSLRTYFYEVLHKFYTEANRVKNECKAVLLFKAKREEFDKKEKNSDFLDAKEKAKMQLDLEQMQVKAQKAMGTLEKLNAGDTSSTIDKIKESIVQKSGVLASSGGISVVNKPIKSDKTSGSFITTSFSYGERKLLDKIFEIINVVAPKNIADLIKEKIRKELSDRNS